MSLSDRHRLCSNSKELCHTNKNGTSMVLETDVQMCYLKGQNSHASESIQSAAEPSNHSGSHS